MQRCQDITGRILSIAASLSAQDCLVEMNGLEAKQVGADHTAGPRHRPGSDGAVQEAASESPDDPFLNLLVDGAGSRLILGEGVELYVDQGSGTLVDAAPHSAKGPSDDLLGNGGGGGHGCGLELNRNTEGRPSDGSRHAPCLDTRCFDTFGTDRFSVGRTSVDHTSVASRGGGRILEIPDASFLFHSVDFCRGGMIASSSAGGSGVAACDVGGGPSLLAADEGFVGTCYSGSRSSYYSKDCHGIDASLAALLRSAPELLPYWQDKLQDSSGLTPPPADVLVDCCGPQCVHNAAGDSLQSGVLLSSAGAIPPDEEA